ncbi:hypothetical protein CNYM01_07359 [Colletotrichum nymphaeae SA-01]|uniref:Fungal N-terminal domain-containing protein n=1 Tax=Colletotrichum nymphaeae SA-01 TaxID=1460502 RepID=A0A135TXV4_9PEZI|nr:hypothetical protein CNYM01_07359 [Colletotrichum nymphaeae SA-01]
MEVAGLVVERLTGWLDNIIQTIAILHPLLKSVDAGGQPLHAQHIEGLEDILTRCRQALVILNERLSEKNFIKKFVIQETKQYLDQIGKSMDEVRNTLGELGQAVKNVRDDSRSTAEVIHGHFQHHAKAENRQIHLDWISTQTFVLEQTDFLNMRYEGTGTWFLESQRFKTWLFIAGSKKRCRILFCLVLAAKFGRRKVYEMLLKKEFSIGYQVPLQLDCFARGMLEQQSVWGRICSLCCWPTIPKAYFEVCNDCKVIVCLTCRRRGNHLMQPCEPPQEHHSMQGKTMRNGPDERRTLKTKYKNFSNVITWHRNDHTGNLTSGSEGYALDWVFEGYELMKKVQYEL